MQNLFLWLSRQQRLLLVLMGVAVCLLALPLDSLWEVAWLGVLGTGYVLLGLLAVAPRQWRVDFSMLGPSAPLSDDQSTGKRARQSSSPRPSAATALAAQSSSSGDDTARIAEILKQLRTKACHSSDRDGLAWQVRRQIFIVGVDPDWDDAERLFVDREEPDVMLWPGQFHIHEQGVASHQCPPGTVDVMAGQGAYFYQAEDGRTHRLDEVWFTTFQMVVSCHLIQERARMAGRSRVGAFSPTGQNCSADLYFISQLLREGMLVFHEYP